MGKMRAWWCLGAVFALLASGCGGNSSSDPVVAPNGFPYGLSSSDATFDENNDGFDEGVSSTGFTYDGAGRVVGFQMQRQLDSNEDGIMDVAETLNMKLDPNIAFDPELVFFDEIGPTAASSPSAFPAAEVLPARIGYFDDRMLMIAYLAKAAPVEIKTETYSLNNIFYLTLETPEAMLLRERTTTTFSYNTKGKPLEISQLYESNSDVYMNKLASGTNSVKFLVTFSYDENDNPTRVVSTWDAGNDGWLEEKWIVNYINTYENGRLTQVIQQDPASTWIETITYAYDEAGNRLMERDEQSSDGEVVDIDLTEWTYDAAGRKTSEIRKEDWNGDGTWDDFEGVNWSYDEAGRLATKEEWWGVESEIDLTTSYSYDEAGRLIAIRVANAGETDIENTTFVYDENDRLLGHSRGYTSTSYEWQETYAFAYDDLGELTGYTFEDYWDGNLGRKEEAVATLDGQRIAFAVEMFEGSELALSGKRTFDLAFRNGLPKSEMALPLLFYEEELTVTLPIVPAYIMMFDILHGWMGSR